jgi:hypothetical protein
MILRVSGTDSGKEHLPLLHYYMIKLYRFNFLIWTTVVEYYDECLAMGALILLLLGSTVSAPITGLSVCVCVFLLNALTTRYPVLYFLNYVLN